ncbi:MAG: polysaccharide deacetylase family protein [Deltaproteobacteria bacterium]|nr:polysaccharide deacetylase family protein [Deltaproteobacteria bacterium]
MISALGSSYIQKKIRSDLTIVMYHSVVEKLPQLYDWCYVDAESFRRQVSYLKNNFEVIPLSRVPGRLRSGRTGRPLAVITFDDGYQNNFDVAFPILREEGLPATIFLTTGLINTDDTLWVCRLHEAFSNTEAREVRWEGKIFPIGGQDEKVELIAQMKNKFKTMPIAEIRPLLKAVVHQLGYDLSQPVAHDSLYGMLDFQSINVMRRSGLIDFGAHTMAHEILSCLPPEEQEKEIKGSLNTVSEITGKKCTLFAYPNGAGEDYNDETIEILRQCGIEVSLTTIEEMIDGDTPLLELRRYSIGPGMDMGYFKLLVIHFITWFKGLKLSH